MDELLECVLALVKELLEVGTPPGEVVEVIRSVLLLGLKEDGGDGYAVDGKRFRHTA